MQFMKGARISDFNENAILAPFSSTDNPALSQHNPLGRSVSLPLSAQRTVGFDVLSVNVAAIGTAIAPNRQCLTISGKGQVEP